MTTKTLTSTLNQLGRENVLMEVKTVAEAASVTPWWVRRLIANGELRAINVGGHGRHVRWRVDPEDLNAWMRSRENRRRDLMV